MVSECEAYLKDTVPTIKYKSTPKTHIFMLIPRELEEKKSE